MLKPGNILRGKERQLLGALILIVATVSGAVLYHTDQYVFLYFGDAASHIVKARQFIDSQRSGIANLGTVWLPLPHLLLVPFVAVDALFYTGIAGPVLGTLCLVGTGMLLFDIILSLVASKRIAFLFAALFTLNPNVMYMAFTPMNEPALLFFVTLCGYAFFRWLSTDDEQSLNLSCLAASLACLCRYEAWPLVPFISMIIVLKAMRRGPERGRRLRRALGSAALCSSGILFWLYWNFIAYGDAIKFAHWTYEVSTPVRDTQRMNATAVLSIFGQAALMLFGPVLIALAAGALFRFRRLVSDRRTLLLYAFFLLPVLFTLISVLIGFVQVDKWWWNWRYVLTLGLFLTIAGAVGLSALFDSFRSPILPGIVIAGMLAMPVAQMVIPEVGVSTYKDARKGFYDITWHGTEFGAEFRKHYQSGTVAVLAGYGQAQRIELAARLPLKKFRIIYDPGDSTFLDGLAHADRYLILGKDRTPESKEYVDYWLSRREMLNIHYKVLFENAHYLFLECRITPVELHSAQNP
jgi:hypothetical protein